MKTKHLIILIIICSSISSFAQNNFVKGYIITRKNDTLHGEIKDRFPARIGYAIDKVEFKDKEGNIKKFTPRKLKGYSKLDKLDYMSIILGSYQYYGRIVLEGPVRLLHMKRNSQGVTMMPAKDTIHDKNYEKKILNIEDVYYLYNKEKNKFYRLYSSKLIYAAEDCFSDYKELVDMIEKKQLKYSDIHEIVKKYNNWKISNSP